MDLEPAPEALRTAFSKLSEDEKFKVIVEGCTNFPTEHLDSWIRFAGLKKGGFRAASLKQPGAAIFLTRIVRALEGTGVESDSWSTSCTGISNSKTASGWRAL